MRGRDEAKRCSKCVHYFPIIRTSGECKAHPPKMYMEKDKNTGGVNIGCRSPRVSPNSWCGEWKGEE